MNSLERFARTIPKAELHLHIEGSLEPELMFALAKRNGLPLPYADVEAVRCAYQFTDLQSFLDIYYAGASVLVTTEDFFDLTWAYLERAHADATVHTEIFFDPQTHTARGVDMAVVIDGITRALAAAEQRWGMSSALILCFLRHLSQDEAFATLEQARPFLQHIAGVGLDSSELGHPPSKFTQVFDTARAMGLRVVAHAGEEGPVAYIEEALDVLKVERIDHGVRASDSPAMLARLAALQMPLTVCPLSNIKLRVFETMAQHNLLQLLRAGLCVTVNADDPAYFGGYLGDNFAAVVHALHPSEDEVRALAVNSLQASFLPQARKAQLIQLAQRFTL
jgi:adenine deaminase